MTIFDDIRKDRDAGTPDLGGWAWSGGRDDLKLSTRNGGRRWIMTFERKGMRSAQPCFQTKGRMVKAIDHLTKYEVGDGAARGQKEADADRSVYRMDVSGVDHPDARRIARTPDLERIALAAAPLADAAHDAFLEAYELTKHIEGADRTHKHRMDALKAFREARQ